MKDRNFDLGAGTHLYLFLRWYFTPYRRLARYLPNRGLILDMGCGYGLLSITAAAKEPNRTIIAFDIDRERLRVARHASRGLANLMFVDLPIEKLSTERYSAVAAVDVVHYFDPVTQVQLIKKVHSLLEAGGVFLMREIDAHSSLASWWNRSYEKAAIKFGLTQVAQSCLSFRGLAEWKSLLEGSGFKVNVEKCTNFFFADVLFVCEKNE